MRIAIYKKEILVSLPSFKLQNQQTCFPDHLQSWTTKARQFYCGRTAGRNGSIFVGSSLALKKESIAHFSGFLVNCLGCRQNFEGKKK
jgi:hypothetical protein